MSNENFMASPEPKSISGPRQLRVFKWIIASVAAISLFGTGFAIAYASSRKSSVRETSRDQVALLPGTSFPSNQVSPGYYTPTIPVVAQRNVSQLSSPGQQLTQTPSPSFPSVSTNNFNGFPGSSNPYANNTAYQPAQTYYGVYTQPVVGRPLNDSQEEQVANQATSEILAKLRNARGEQRDELMTKLRSSVSEQFDIRHAQQSQQIEELEKQLQKSKELHKKRAEKKEEIISRRIGQLLNDPDELDWNRNVIGQNNMPRNAYSLPPNSYPQYSIAPGWSNPPTNYPAPNVQAPSTFQPQYPGQYTVPPQFTPGVPPQSLPESTAVAPRSAYRSEEASPSPPSTRPRTPAKPAENSTEAIQPPQVSEEASAGTST